MAVFDEAAKTYLDAEGHRREQLDWAMLKYGPIALFRKLTVLTETITWLERHGYVVAQVDCERCLSKQAVLSAIGEALGFYPWPNPGLDRFNSDCHSIEVPDEGGLAVVLHGSMSWRSRSRISPATCWTSWLGRVGTTCCSVGG